VCGCRIEDMDQHPHRVPCRCARNILRSPHLFVHRATVHWPSPPYSGKHRGSPDWLAAPTGHTSWLGVNLCSLARLGRSWARSVNSISLLLVALEPVFNMWDVQVPLSAILGESCQRWHSSPLGKPMYKLGSPK